MMEGMTIERLSLVGGGRHMRLRLRHGHHSLNAICFSTTPESASIEPGDLVDVAFQPQINEFRGERSVQLNIVDIRPTCRAACDCDDRAYRRLCNGTLTPADATRLLPDRTVLAAVWRYLAGCGGSFIKETPACLCRKVVRKAGIALHMDQLLACLDIFADVGLLYIQRPAKYLIIRLADTTGKADLQQSRTLQLLLSAKES